MIFVETNTIFWIKHVGEYSFIYASNSAMRLLMSAIFKSIDRLIRSINKEYSTFYLLKAHVVYKLIWK